MPASPNQTPAPECTAFPDDAAEAAALLPAIPAASVIIAREDPGAAAGPPQLLMVRRATSLAFAGGMAVFPGGRVDPDDEHLGARMAEAHALSLTDASARVAAIRETLEETGLPLAIASKGGAGLTDVDWGDVRAALLSGAALSDLLDQHGLSIDLAALTPFARWRPNHQHVRIFDTRFYIARADGPMPDLSIVAHESSALFWASAEQVLEQVGQGQVEVIFPTHRNLERLAQFADFPTLAESARAIPARRITPFIEQREGGPHLCIPDDRGYPVTSHAMASARRG